MAHRKLPHNISRTNVAGNIIYFRFQDDVTELSNTYNGLQ